MMVFITFTRAIILLVPSLYYKRELYVADLIKIYRVFNYAEVISSMIMSHHLAMTLTFHV